jgi:hypothetical protein
VEPGTLRVTLAWDAGLPLAPTDRYGLVRDGLEILSTPDTTASDTLPGPGTYTYTVQALAGAERSALSAPLTLTASALPCTLVQTPEALSLTCQLAPPPPPPAGPPAGPYPRRPVGTVTVLAVDSQETTGENGRATQALDGLTTTIWHTQWQGTTPPLPHTLTLDLGAVGWVDGVSYLPRQSGGLNGTLTSYRVETSRDGATWTAAAAGTWAYDATAKAVRWAATPGRYVRLVALASGPGQPWASAAEVGIYAVESTP